MEEITLFDRYIIGPNGAPANASEDLGKVFSRVTWCFWEDARFLNMGETVGSRSWEKQCGACRFYVFL